MAVNVKTQDFEEQVAKASGPVLVDFWASWCGPCRMLAPVIDQLAAEQTDVKVCKVNIDEEPGLAQRFGVMSIPTVVLFENGQEKNPQRGPCAQGKAAGAAGTLIGLRNPEDKTAFRMVFMF